MWATCKSCGEIGNVHVLHAFDDDTEVTAGPFCAPCRVWQRTAWRTAGFWNIHVKGDGS